MRRDVKLCATYGYEVQASIIVRIKLVLADNACIPIRVFVVQRAFTHSIFITGTCVTLMSQSCE